MVTCFAQGIRPFIEQVEAFVKIDKILTARDEEDLRKEVNKKLVEKKKTGLLKYEYKNPPTTVLESLIEKEE
jgi:hypothetical protein